MKRFLTIIAIVVFTTLLSLVPSAIAIPFGFYDGFDGSEVNINNWHIPTWVSPTDGTYIGRTQFRVSQNSTLPSVGESNVAITVQSYNPTGFSFYGTDLISNQSIFALRRVYCNGASKN